MEEPKYPFAELPAGLVEEILEQTSAVGQLMYEEFTGFRSNRQKLRDSLKGGDWLRHESSLSYPPLPTTCATDGSYAIERLLSVDLTAAAAVAVEGLTPPSEKRYWEEPRHSTFIAAEKHQAETATILRAVMVGRELELATKAPHELVMLDMTATLPIIYFNQACTQAPSSPILKCSQEFIDNCISYLNAYLTILRATRSDKNCVALPKYSSRREIGYELQWLPAQDDRASLTMVLDPGEFTKPIQIERPDQSWHFNIGLLPASILPKARELANEITDALTKLYVFHYKPHQWMPALRVELAPDAANNQYRLASIIQGIKHQCAAPGMMEPYPLYLADRTVKALARAIPIFRQVATQHMAEKYQGNIGEVFFAMHGYRTDSGGNH